MYGGVYDVYDIFESLYIYLFFASTESYDNLTFVLVKWSSINDLKKKYTTYTKHLLALII